MSDDRYFHWLSHFFFAYGMDADDLYQEARIAAWLAPERGRLAAYRQVLDCIKIANRKLERPVPFEIVAEERNDPADVVEAREQLRSILRAVRTRNEEIALGRAFRGEPIRREEKSLGVALFRFRERVA